MNVGQLNQAKSSRPSIESALDSLNSRIDALVALAKELETRSAFFLGPDNTEVAGQAQGTVRQQNSPLHNALDVIDWKLDDLTRQFQRILNRIEP